VAAAMTAASKAVAGISSGGQHQPVNESKHLKNSKIKLMAKKKKKKKKKLAAPKRNNRAHKRACACAEKIGHRAAKLAWQLKSEATAENERKPI